MAEKYKLIMIGDHPLSPSGVGTQFKYIIDALVASQKFKIIALGAALKHQDYRPQRTDLWGEDVTIIPVDGYVNKDLIRQILDIEKPDALWFVTDPRFYVELWQMEDEIHQHCPLIYWHLWDNPPFPEYNKVFYDSTDKLVCINKLTYKFLTENGYADKCEYLPHGVPEDDYKILSSQEILKLRKNHAGADENSFIVFYNSRNALRKRTNNVLWAFKMFIDKLSEADIKKYNPILLAHTPPHDPEGSNLFEVVKVLGLKGRVAFSEKRVSNKEMCEFYNLADVTMSLSSEEGFGLSVLESLQCGTPVICSKTGGMQDQIIDEEKNETFGFCLDADATSLVGSQVTPYIYSHHIDPESACDKLLEMFNHKKECEHKLDSKYKWAGQKSRDSVLRRFNLKQIQNRMTEIVEEEIVKFKENKASKSIKIEEI